MAPNPEARKKLRSLIPGLFTKIVNTFTVSRSERRANVIGCVIHTTESGTNTIDGVVSYFCNPNVEVSSHYVVNDIAGKGELWTKVVRVVPESKKAWTARSANPYFVQYELVGRASRTRREWLTTYVKQLDTVAALVADDVLQYGFPIQRSVPGIVGHGDLDDWGFPNDHTDPGENFPWAEFLNKVRFFVNVAQRPDVTDV